MHQKIEDSPKTTKKMILSSVIITTAKKMVGGTGTFEDMQLLISALNFCKKKYEDNPRLGFKDNIDQTYFVLAGITTKACLGNNVSQSNWNCPFVTLAETRCIKKFTFLLEQQFLQTPMLSTDLLLEDHFQQVLLQGYN